MKKALLIMSLSLISHILISQNFNENLLHIVDSLKTELSASRDETTTLEILRQTALAYTSIDMDSVIYHGQKFIDASEKYHDHNRLLDALGIVGGAYINKGELPKALELSLQAIKINEDNPGLIYTDLIPGIGPAYYNLSEIYFQIGDDEKAHEYANKEINTGTSKIGKGFGHYQKGRVFERSNQLDSAMRHINLSLGIFDDAAQEFAKFSDKYDLSPDGYNLLAKVYIKQGKPDMALAEFKNILGINISKGETLNTAITYNDLAYFFSTQSMPDSSIYYAKKALVESEKIDYVKGKLDACTVLAQKYESIDPVNALYYYKLASTTQNSLYGAGNIQVLKDMIAQNDKRRQEVEAAKVEFKNQLKTYTFLGITSTLLVLALFLFRNNRQKQKAKQKIESAYEQLKSTQTQLIQSEKMASLGELTAGIAHEIQNPLNFVNNFAEVSGELIQEIKEERQKQKEERDEQLELEVLNDLEQNLEKINHHGKRASGIVQGMLSHSRANSGEKAPTDINQLADEYFRLAYHGLRAKDKSFNARMETDFDDSIGKIEVIPQDIGRVILNLITNAFQAISDSGVSDSADRSVSTYTQDGLVKVSTKKIGDRIEISVRDNGPGIPDDIKDKIFQPFFTTKPTGEGTGLGLSLAYDIVKAHGGELKVLSQKGSGTEFIISIPVV